MWQQLGLLLFFCTGTVSCSSVLSHHRFTPELACTEFPGSDSIIFANTLKDYVKPYLRACWDVDAMVACWEDIITNGNATHGWYDSVYIFPHPDDIKRAYYLFCVRGSYKVEQSFLEQRQPKDCDSDHINEKCDPLVDQFALEKMRMAQRDKDLRLALYFACDAMIKTVLCKRDLYVECYEGWETIMDLELAKLGPDCLERYQIHTSVTMETCDEPNTDGSSSVTDVWLAKGMCVLVSIVLYSL